ncbi:hypothetical protein OKW21_000086 [Catalinimonas alkaloidigena]|uniref:hypothetical protein n=1 Tax=Catalinimonas alkaloidigena TaxID=1075417 RepID=UPI002406827E|nr:hypothetical protein [Catalinimonas alkaloidigena]MDF9794823.1 hypothetical protein [Catalinimonas alkaloidigena]
MDKYDAFDQLRQLLLEEDQQEHELLVKQVKELEESINIRKRLQQKVEPIIDEKFEMLKENFPEIYGQVITKTIKTQIRESRDEVIDALYPIIGKLIQKYIVSEISALSERIDRQLAHMFSWEIWLAHIKSWFSGQPVAQHLLSHALPPTIEEVFVVRQYSSTLIGSYSREGLMDGDMVASMLTAIKSFVKEAFAKHKQDLEVIEYETYKIFIKNFQTFYIAITISGVVNQTIRKRIDNLTLDFAQMYMQSLPIKEMEREDYLSEPLNQFFTNVKL